MTCDPHWTSYISAFLVPLVACIAAFIAFRQWRTAQNKLKLDLFEKRLSIYHSTTAFISSVMTSGKASDDEIRKFMIGTREAKWLLSKEIALYLDEQIYNKAIDLQTLHSMLEGEPVGDVRTKNVTEQAEIKKWLAAQFSVIDEYFKPYLKIKH
ncbi:hypothetical protein NX722_24335 [Endozoicomonas gorgoniicola]|uniref:DUF2489 domain-containing protein n=1 Tax=Endozoicomonas gorgoniicola TaxID=1234144 RepID=A0ABT3N263_9GAMM|nr:hypothetical protein [Endozoicomonas gorgoniicola]MCW7555699.1 hypothetical protein [Endozoicomonas gorgoniicola]